MSTDEQKARRERAEQLRRQIEQLKTGADSPADEADDEDVAIKPGESPREYIERRKREIERKKRSKDER